MDKSIKEIECALSKVMEKFLGEQIIATGRICQVNGRAKIICPGNGKGYIAFILS